LAVVKLRTLDISRFTPAETDQLHFGFPSKCEVAARDTTAIGHRLCRIAEELVTSPDGKSISDSGFDASSGRIRLALLQLQIRLRKTLLLPFPENYDPANEEAAN